MRVQEEKRIKADWKDVVNQDGSFRKGTMRGRKRNNAYAPYKKTQQSSRPGQHAHYRFPRHSYGALGSSSTGDKKRENSLYDTQIYIYPLHATKNLVIPSLPSN